MEAPQFCPLFLRPTVSQPPLGQSLHVAYIGRYIVNLPCKLLRTWSDIRREDRGPWIIDHINLYLPHFHAPVERHITH